MEKPGLLAPWVPTMGNRPGPWRKLKGKRQCRARIPSGAQSPPLLPSAGSPHFTRKVSDREKHSPRAHVWQSHGQGSRYPSLVVDMKEGKRATGRRELWARPSGQLHQEAAPSLSQEPPSAPCRSLRGGPGQGGRWVMRSDVGVT